MGHQPYDKTDVAQGSTRRSDLDPSSVDEAREAKALVDAVQNLSGKAFTDFGFGGSTLDGQKISGQEGGSIERMGGFGAVQIDGETTEEQRKEKKRRSVSDAIFDATLDQLRELARIRDEIDQLNTELAEMEERLLGDEAKLREGETEAERRKRVAERMDEKYRNGEISKSDYDRWKEQFDKRGGLEKTESELEQALKKSDQKYQTVSAVTEYFRELEVKQNELKERRSDNAEFAGKLKNLRATAQAHSDTGLDIAFIQILNEHSDIAARLEAIPGFDHMTTEERLEAAEAYVNADQQATEASLVEIEAEMGKSDKEAIKIAEEIVSEKNRDFSADMSMDYAGTF